MKKKSVKAAVLAAGSISLLSAVHAADINALFNTPAGRAQMTNALLGPAEFSDVIIENLVVEHGLTDSGDVNRQQIGFFQNAGPSIGITQGILLATGSVNDIASPASFFLDRALGTSANTLLSSVVQSRATNDPVVISFDVTPERDRLNLTLVFGSEEYPDFACSQFNDAFGIFIEGGEFTTAKNMAIEPGNGTTITINNINGSTIGEPNPSGSGTCGSALFYRQNLLATPAGTDIALNGFTSPITVAEPVTSGETYRVSLIIADAVDGRYDSAAFFGFLSSTWSFDVDLSLDVEISGGFIDGTPSFEFGQEAVFELVVENQGPAGSGAVQVEFPFPSDLFNFTEAVGEGSYDAGTGLWTIGFLPANETRTIEIKGIANAPGSRALFTEIISGTGEDPNSRPGNGPRTPVEDDEATINLQVIESPEVCPTGTDITGSGLASSGSGAFLSTMYWLDWGCGTLDEFNPGDWVSKRWEFGNVEIRALLGNITAPLQPYVSGTGAGDAFQIAYSGVNPVGLANLSGTGHSFDIVWEKRVNGVQVPMDLVVVDAESTNAGEQLVMRSNGAPWELIEVSPGADISMAWELAGQQIRVAPAGSGGGSFLAVTSDVSFTSQQLIDPGIQAIGFGVPVQIDFGDLPASYPDSGGHYLRYEATAGGKPSTATPITSISQASWQPQADTPFIGAVRPSPRLGPTNSANADAHVEDEGVLLPARFVPGEQTTISIEVDEATVGSGYLQGWIDWNQDGSFNGIGEHVVINLRDNGAADTNPVNGIITVQVFVPPNAQLGNTFARFRFSSEQDIPFSDQLALDGEIEDYEINIGFEPDGATLRGMVFNDNGTGSGTAHNGLIDGSEVGVAGALVRAFAGVTAPGECNTSAPELARTVTAGDGSWQLKFDIADSGNQACILVQPAGGVFLVSEDAGTGIVDSAVADDGQMRFVVPSAITVWEDINFGVVPKSVLEPDNQGVSEPGSSINYYHRYKAQTSGVVDFSATVEAQSPNTLDWAQTLYQDLSCSQNVSVGAPITNISVVAGDEICLVLRVFVPANAPVGAFHQVQITADNALSGTARVDSAVAFDNTGVQSGRLRLDKLVRNIGPDGVSGTADDVDTVGLLSNQAKPCDVIRYSVFFANDGTMDLDEVVIYDQVPAFTELAQPISCPGTLPSGISACQVATPNGANAQGYEGGLQWQFTGQLGPGETGELSFDVRVKGLLPNTVGASCSAL